MKQVCKKHKIWKTVDLGGVMFCKKCLNEGCKRMKVVNTNNKIMKRPIKLPKYILKELDEIQQIATERSKTYRQGYNEAIEEVEKKVKECEKKGEVFDLVNSPMKKSIYFQISLKEWNKFKKQIKLLKTTNLY